MIEEIRKMVKKKYREQENVRYNMNLWDSHIVRVEKYSKILAKKLGADEEIVDISAILHDFAAINNEEWHKEHHIHGARLAEKILKKYKYPQEKIEKVKHCIEAHRGSVEIPRKSVEAEIIASADAMAHFDEVEMLVSFHHKYLKMSLEEAKKKVLEKVERDWEKMIPEAREIMKEKYESIKTILQDE